MGFKAELKGNKAYKLHGNGQYAEAKALYAEAYAEGMSNPKHIMGYAILLIRGGDYALGREILVKLQKHPGLTPDLKNQLFTSYAAAVFRMGEIDKGIHLLERQHAHGASGLVYQTLGYLYVEKYALEHRPDFDALEAAEAAAKAEAEAAEAAEAEAANGEGAEAPERVEESAEAPERGEESAEAQSPREAWDEGVQRAAAFIDESIDYDDEDSICLDNKGQFLYRVLGDREGAKAWFEKALRYKDNQIDTLWFLSRYDLEAGNTAAAVEKLENILKGRFSPLNYVNKEMAETELARLKA